MSEITGKGRAGTGAGAGRAFLLYRGRGGKNKEAEGGRRHGKAREGQAGPSRGACWLCPENLPAEQGAVKWSTSWARALGGPEARAAGMFFSSASLQYVEAVGHRMKVNLCFWRHPGGSGGGEDISVSFSFFF